MPIPEKGTPEYAVAEHRINRRIMDTVSNVAVRRGDLPEQVHALVHDDITGRKFGSFIQVRYVDESGMAQVTRTSQIGILAPNATPRDVADILVKHDPDTPLVLDDRMTGELSNDSVTWFEDDHCSLQGVSGGTIEVYTPFKSTRLSKEGLSPEAVSGQLFEE